MAHVGPGGSPPTACHPGCPPHIWFGAQLLALDDGASPCVSSVACPGVSAGTAITPPPAVDDLQAAVDAVAANGYGLFGGIGQPESTWRMAQVRGPEGIVVSLSERIG